MQFCYLFHHFNFRGPPGLLTALSLISRKSTEPVGFVTVGYVGHGMGHVGHGMGQQDRAQGVQVLLRTGAHARQLQFLPSTCCTCPVYNRPGQQPLTLYIHPLHLPIQHPAPNCSVHTSLRVNWTANLPAATGT